MSYIRKEKSKLEIRKFDGHIGTATGARAVFYSTPARAMRFTDIGRSEAAKIETGCQLLHEGVFPGFHFFAGGGFLIVITAQVKDSVDRVAHEFALPCSFIFRGLAHGFIHAEENIAGEQGREHVIGIIESDNVGGAVMPEMSFIYTRHCGCADEINGQSVVFAAQILVKNRFDDSGKIVSIHAARSLLISQKEPGFHSSPGASRPFPRCSSYAAMIRWTSG